MSRVKQFVQERMQEPVHRQPAPLVLLSPRIHEVYVEALDAMAERLHMSRTGLAAELIIAAIEDSGPLLGVEVMTEPADDPYSDDMHVALFPDPREKKE